MKDLSINLTITCHPPMSAEQVAAVMGEDKAKFTERPIPASVDFRSKPFETPKGNLYVASGERVIIGEKTDDRKLLNVIGELLEEADKQHSYSNGLDYLPKEPIQPEETELLSKEPIPCDVTFIVKTVKEKQSRWDPLGQKDYEFQPAVGWKFDYITKDGGKKQYGDYMTIRDTMFDSIMEAIAVLLYQYRSVYAEVEKGEGNEKEI